MNRAVTITLRIAFLIGLVYVLAAVFGAVQGFSMRGPDLRLAVGKKAQGKKCRNRTGVVLAPAYRNARTGMVSTLIASAGTDVPRVGIQSMVP